jgi:hypothetical protein
MEDDGLSMAKLPAISIFNFPFQLHVSSAAAG